MTVVPEIRMSFLKGGVIPGLVAVLVAGLVACSPDVPDDSEFDVGGSATGGEAADEVASEGSDAADTSTDEGIDPEAEGGTGQESWEWTCPNPQTPSECPSPARPLEILSYLEIDPDPSCLSQWTCAYEGDCTVVSVDEANELVVELDCESQMGDSTLPRAIHYAENESWNPPAPGTELYLRYQSSYSDVLSQGLSAVRVEDGQGQLVFAYVKTGFKLQLEQFEKWILPTSLAAELCLEPSNLCQQLGDGPAWLTIGEGAESKTMFAGHCCQVGAYRIWVAESHYLCESGRGFWEILVVSAT